MTFNDLGEEWGVEEGRLGGLEAREVVREQGLMEGTRNTAHRPICQRFLCGETREK